MSNSPLRFPDLVVVKSTTRAEDTGIDDDEPVGVDADADADVDEDERNPLISHACYSVNY